MAASLATSVSRSCAESLAHATVAPVNDPVALVRAVQATPDHYRFETYDDLERWSSYWYQIRTALRLAPKTVLEIGSGTGVFRAYLQHAGVDVKSADIDATRAPDFLADVANLDATLPAGLTFDVVCAFQVLEHLPFAEFERCLDGLSRRGRHVLISLPVHGFQLRLAIGVGSWRPSFGVYVPYFHQKHYHRQHHWELGWGYSVRQITRLLSARFEVRERFFVKENPYHYMWVLRSPER